MIPLFIVGLIVWGGFVLTRNLKKRYPILFTDIKQLDRPEKRQTRSGVASVITSLIASSARMTASVKLSYESGLAGVKPCVVQVWADDGALKIGVGLGQVTTLPREALVGLNVVNDIQRVAVNSGSKGGAIVMFGRVGAVVGNRSRTKIKTYDESRTYLLVRNGSLETQIVFLGGADTHAKLAKQLAAVMEPT